MTESRRVYSTAEGDLRTGREPARHSVPTTPNDGVVRVSRETSGRRGKTVTVVRGIPPRELDLRFWSRGQAPEYKAVPRHRTRTVYY